MDTKSETKRDIELLNQSLKGKQEALSQLIRVLTPVIQFRVVRALLRREASASGRDIRQELEDLTQEIFLFLLDSDARVLRSWDPKRGMSLKNYVGLVADRQLISLFRMGKRNPWTEDPTLPEDLERVKASDDSTGAKDTGSSLSLDVEDRMINKELLLKVLEYLEETLSPLGRLLFTLLYIEQCPVAEVCAKTNMSTNAVYAWRSRLRKLTLKSAEKILSEAPFKQRKPTWSEAK